MALKLDGEASYKWATTVAGETLQNVTFVRADGFDVELWVKGTLGGRTVIVPKSQITGVFN